jgi:hypothetical protein|tara:strand:- start:9 stop:212 length:204 start_codon:yes stop_codon:yes gene_type:complete
MLSDMLFNFHPNALAATTIADGATRTFTCAGTAGTAGSKYKNDITFAYTGDGGLTHSKTGTLTTKYE